MGLFEIELENNPSPGKESVPHKLIFPMNMYDMILPAFFHQCKSATTSL